MCSELVSSKSSLFHWCSISKRDTPRGLKLTQRRLLPLWNVPRDRDMNCILCSKMKKYANTHLLRIPLWQRRAGSHQRVGSEMVRKSSRRTKGSWMNKISYLVCTCSFVRVQIISMSASSSVPIPYTRSSCHTKHVVYRACVPSLPDEEHTHLAAQEASSGP